MIIKKYTHYAVVFNYFFSKGDERKHYTKGSKIFYEGDTLYSYGTHFPLAVKCRNGYVLNGDTYSGTTSSHQWLTRDKAALHSFFQTHKITNLQIQSRIDELNNGQTQTLWYIDKNPTIRPLESLYRDHNNNRMDTCDICSRLQNGHTSTHHCIIPFSALEGADIRPQDVFILDVTEDTYETVKRKNPKTGEIEDYKIHHLGASLIRRKTGRYLSSIDNGSRRNMFYLVELKSRRVNTVEEAFRDLAGNLTDKQYREYQLGNIQRQGEYFLEAHPEISTRDLKKQAKRMPVKIKEILEVTVKTSHRKRVINDLIRRENMGYGGIAREQIKVMRQNGVPYYVIFNRDHVDLDIPEGAIIRGSHLVTYKPMVTQYDLSQGVGNPHIARDAIRTTDSLFVRGTVRHSEHRMIRMDNIWHKIYRNTALNSWTANGGVD